MHAEILKEMDRHGPYIISERTFIDIIKAIEKVNPKLLIAFFNIGFLIRLVLQFNRVSDGFFSVFLTFEVFSKFSLVKKRFGYKGENMSKQIQELLDLETASCCRHIS